ncbi:MAG: exodeoxyribonuclease VII large subunit [Pseudomonadota bacterium]
MSDLIDPLARGGANQQEFSVSEISTALKKTVEGSFDNVRVRGEISGLKSAASGHIYFALKDDRAVLDAVCWRGTKSGLALQLADGMEVVISGYMTTYPARSRYQLVVEDVRLAGVGALLQMLEKLKEKLQAEGLFAQSAKKPIPYLPRRIGVVTSQTGAVIKDILHRLQNRFPSHVLLWPVLVQGKGAAGQIAAAITGFNAITDADKRPDVLIVARGGGSLEDLWAFNEEVVVRAAARSDIPLISAVGHETDTTLIDFASDLRAPTPTAAAEMVVPVRADLQTRLGTINARMRNAMTQRIEKEMRLLRVVVGSMPKFHRFTHNFIQRLDEMGARTIRAMTQNLAVRKHRISGISLMHPRTQLQNMHSKLDGLSKRAQHAASRNIDQAKLAVKHITPDHLARVIFNIIAQTQRDFDKNAPAIFTNIGAVLQASQYKSDQLIRLLDSLSHRAVLRRGFALARKTDGTVISTAKEAKAAGSFALHFHDGAITVGGGGYKMQKPARGQQNLGKADLGQMDLL